MTNQLFESALGMTAPWYIQGVDFDAAQRQLTIAADFVAGSRFAYGEVAGEHTMYRRMDSDASDQRIYRGYQRPVSARQTQGTKCRVAGRGLR
ncbi:hypothetical protein PQR18_37805 [Paraburkholderia sediminicola]|uniref:hypothetical protein n=1 Tax=Paraburkholderia sediminicola TaxID=458836 RepID=UPI0038B6C968